MERLKGIFRKEGCRPEHNGNYVLLLIDEPCLDAALSISGLSSTALLQNGHSEYPELRLYSGPQLVCLNSKHRIQARRGCLGARDKWWVAELYLEGEFVYISSRVIIIQFDFRYQPWRPATPDRGLLERGTPNRRRDLLQDTPVPFSTQSDLRNALMGSFTGQLDADLKSILRHDQITAAFDALLDMPGQWNGMQFTTIHKMMALKFDEVGHVGHYSLLHAHSLASGNS